MSRSSLAEELALIETLARDDLSARWVKAFGTVAPAGVRLDLLIRGITWDVQTRRLGGLSTVARRLLKAAKVDTLRRRAQRSKTALGESQAQPLKESYEGPNGAADALHPGSRIVRDWCGQPHTVDVVENGYVYEGKVYRSLSSIARVITGTNWSGPRFFGLVNRRASS
ncbi:DUF2924 domain-containing protein [Shinella sp.]|uniref:DUF2924 domain-containing protein n=1 Tax=Shinella sp. TaxID=1870904 RepID=UPI003F71080C